MLGVGRGANNPPHNYSVEKLLKLEAGCLWTILEEAKINQPL
jgi:hypothetical protein